MQTVTISDQIAEVIETSKKSRIYFRNQMRGPMFGQFIKFPDHESMFKRGFVRFLSDANIPVILDGSEFKPRVIDTKLLMISELSQIKNF